MALLNKVHHINLLVCDLDRAVDRYRAAFGLEDIEFGELSQRGVRTARFRAGETWIVLVQPTDSTGVPARHLAEHGEGLFLLSFGVDSLADASARVEAGGGALASVPRNGLDDWQVVDLDPDFFSGATLQLTEETAR